MERMKKALDVKTVNMILLGVNFVLTIMVFIMTVCR